MTFNPFSKRRGYSLFRHSRSRRAFRLAGGALARDPSFLVPMPRRLREAKRAIRTRMLFGVVWICGVHEFGVHVHDIGSFEDEVWEQLNKSHSTTFTLPGLLPFATVLLKMKFGNVDA